MRTNKEIQIVLENELSRLKFNGEPQNLYDPIHYMLDLGGKRLRPCLYLMAYQLFDENIELGIPGALAIEVFHNFTLMHDDIMDNAPKRRGQDSVHEKWNRNSAILSGDVMLVEAYKLITQIESKQKNTLLNLFNSAAIKVCEGQQMDMNFEMQSKVSIPDYLKMIELKTGVLLAYSLKMGAIHAGADLEDANHLFEFGKNIGIAFQLQDDYLDCFGEHAKIGKQIGGDILSNKKTFLWIKALELSNKKQRQELINWESKKDFDPLEKIKEVKKIFLDLKVDELIQKEINKYSQMANQELMNCKIDQWKLAIFTGFSNSLKERVF